MSNVLIGPSFSAAAASNVNYWPEKCQMPWFFFWLAEPWIHSVKRITEKGKKQFCWRWRNLYSCLTSKHVLCTLWPWSWETESRKKSRKASNRKVTLANPSCWHGKLKVNPSGRTTSSSSNSSTNSTRHPAMWSNSSTPVLQVNKFSCFTICWEHIWRRSHVPTNLVVGHCCVSSV